MSTGRLERKKLQKLNNVKIAVLYNLVEKPTDNIPLPENWGDIVGRFVHSYINFEAGFSHDLYVCSSGAPLSLSSQELLQGLNYRSIVYTGAGWDIGAYQYCARFLRSYDLVVCLNSQAYIAQDNWLKYFAEAYSNYGPGVYGASSSFEVSPHIRTSSFAFSPGLIIDYPLTIRCRYDACVFEHSPKSFSLWALSKNMPVYVVIRSGAHKLLQSRREDNIFRRGTQEDLLIRDRHSIIYDGVEEGARIQLEKLADGEVASNFVYLSKIDHFIVRYAVLQRTRVIFSTLKSRLLHAYSRFVV